MPEVIPGGILGENVEVILEEISEQIQDGRSLKKFKKWWLDKYYGILLGFDAKNPAENLRVISRIIRGTTDRIPGGIFIRI